MSKSIQERVRAAIAQREKAEKAAAYKAGESARRSAAARDAAEIRREKHLDLVLQGRAEPRTRAELLALERLEGADFDIDPNGCAFDGGEDS